ncbi:MAG: DUF5671 domain-containing protein [bacterium]|nr:DUF5671 domain-containing protein [bacterium]
MDKPKVTPKDFFLWAGAMVTLYASVVAFISLLFSYLDYVYPDPLAYYTSDPYSGGVSYEMASLIVLFPIFLAISHFIIKSIKADPTREGVWVRRWVIYLTLFAAAAMAAGDLITLIMYFFNGDTTPRFVLKVLVVLLVAVGIFIHYLADLRGYWYREAAKARLVRFAAGALVLVTIGAGFFIIGTPWQARLYRFDEQKVNDLQNIQYQVVNYWQTKRALPATLADLSDPLSGYRVPSDPQAGQVYEYSATGMLSFELCATFNAPTHQGQKGVTPAGIRAPMPVDPTGRGKPIQDTWQHDAGRTCFPRTIDPERYPPLTKQAL